MEQPRGSDLLAVGKLSDDGPNLEERGSMIWVFLEAVADHIEDRLSKVSGVRQLRSKWNALSIAHTINNVYRHSRVALFCH